MPVIDDPLLVLAGLGACVIASELLVRRTALRHAGTALVVIVVTAVVANVGVLPAASTPEHPVPIYDAIFAHVAPLAIFWLLLRVSLRDVLEAGLPLLALFIVGAAGTVLGVVLGTMVIDTHVLGSSWRAIAGMYAATYTGGSANFNALALHYDIVRQGAVYAGAIAVDAGLTAVWMVVTIAVPRLMHRGRAPAVAEARSPSPTPTSDEDADARIVGPLDLAWTLSLGVAGLWAADVITAALDDVGISLPSILVLTALALLLAQVPAIARLRATAPLAMFAVYLFLAVIGAFCDVAALGELGSLGIALGGLATTCLLVHGLVTFIAARLLRLDLALAAIASQANVGGGTTALALARSLNREDLVLPAVLIGAVGTALGTFAGFWVSEQLL